MKLIAFVILISAAVLAGASCATRQVESRSAIEKDSSALAARQPVLVELFTSEGCESCPAAERTLRFLEEQQVVSGAEIIGLAFHVDYWDQYGWKDRFSSSEYTRRQERYALQFGIDSTYTPQMVVDGGTQFIGSDMTKAIKSITRFAATQKGTIAAEFAEGLLKIKIDGLGKHGKATVYLAVAEDGLSTEVGGGENQGRKLDHSSVVRNLSVIGRINADLSDFSTEFRPSIEQGWKADKMRFVVFVQEESDRKILAASRAVAK